MIMAGNYRHTDSDSVMSKVDKVRVDHGLSN